MEKVPGTPLSVLQKGGPRLREVDVLRLLQDADRVLVYLHGRSPPVIHRDIKPSNVIRRPDGTFAFVDFGAVRDRLRPEGGSTVVGTFGYMAPEQFQGRAGPASDVYAVGATAVAMLTGQEPEKLPHRGLSLDVEAALGGSVSAELRRVLASMLEPDPDRRAPRIGPLLERGAAASRTAGGPPWRQWQAAFETAVGEAKSEAKRARREARRAARRERRQARHEWGSHMHDHHPAMVRLAVGLALAIAQVAVGFALQFVVPVVLLVLSAVFGPKLRHAAARVRLAGKRAGLALGEAQARVDHEWPESDTPRVRVATAPGEQEEEVKVRVEAPAPGGDATEDDADEELQAELLDPPARRRKRGADR
jgi:hypothetical protein